MRREREFLRDLFQRIFLVFVWWGEEERGSGKN